MDILIKACNNLDLNTEVYIVGGNPTVEYIQLIDELKLENIKFIGYKTKDELKKYIFY